ncbi:MarR family transcriptional regulator [Brevibacillus humidisoli]|nr:MarR family transcriptional regulator [Brevibacillus humidisoli]UFJ41665.1 MarR family transcriptional regulator [Brevibacillus humidisoli]
MERQPRVFGEAGPLTPTEVHTIDAIGCDAGILMSELAARLGVTKGAVTQLVGRLEGKDLVKRTPHPEDSRAVMVSLTDKGKTAYHQHEILHHHFYNQLREHLNEEEISIFEKGIETLVRILRE